MKKFLTVIGTRPQLIKYDNKLKQVLVWTGQHYDKNMSDVFFKGLKIPKPDYSLNKTDLGDMVKAIIPILKKEKPDYVIVYGDCRSTLAGATAAYNENIPIIHIEAGFRCYDEDMIEERIRKIVDEMAVIHFCPSEREKVILENDHRKLQVHNVGATQIDTMFSTFPTKKPKDAYKYKVMTLHRDFNNEKIKLEDIFESLEDAGVIEFYIHPRTKKTIEKLKIKIPKNIKVKEPLPYKKMINRVAFADKVITDSGGLQLETFFLRRPCITLRSRTEWQETVDQGWNVLCGTDKEKIKAFINKSWRGKGEHEYYGRGNSKKIIRLLLQSL